MPDFLPSIMLPHWPLFHASVWNELHMLITEIFKILRSWMKNGLCHIILKYLNLYWHNLNFAYKINYSNLNGNYFILFHFVFRSEQYTSY